MKSIQKLIMVALIAHLLEACVTDLPNTKPFVDASNALVNASDSSFKATNNSYRNIISNLNFESCSGDKPKNWAEQSEKYMKQLGELEAIEIAFLSVIKETGSYAYRLHNIVKTAEEENKKIADQVQSFNDIFTKAKENSAMAGPYAPMVATGADVVSAINTLQGSVRQDINSLQAIQTLQEAIKKAGTAINDLSEKMDKDFNRLSDLLLINKQVLDTTHRRCHQQEYDYRRNLLHVRQAIIKMITIFSENDVGNKSLITTGAYGGKANAAAIESINQQLQDGRLYYDAIETTRNKHFDEIELAKQLIKESIDTLKSLAKSHEELSKQIEDGGSFDYEKLQYYAEQLESLSDKLESIK